jgi:acetyltransferase-like isoleucine patch superfamily enzyme
MQRYGRIRPIVTTVIAFAKAGGRIIRSVNQQKRLEVGNGVRVAHDVSFFGGGQVSLGDRVTIGSGVSLTVDEGAVIEVGSDSYIGAHSALTVRKGHAIRFGRRFQLGERCRIVSLRGVVWGDDGSLGSESSVLAREGGGQGALVVGSESHLHSHTLIDLCADVVVGDRVHSGPFCAFYTHNHVPMPGKLIWDQNPSFAPIRIGAGTWIGHNCSILPGVSVGDNCILATGAVITSSVEPWTVVGGVPARVLKRILP